MTQNEAMNLPHYRVISTYSSNIGQFVLLMMEDQSSHGEEEEMGHFRKPLSSFSPFLFVLIALPSFVLVSLVLKVDLEVPSLWSWRTGLDKDLASLHNSQLDFSDNISPKLVEATNNLDLKEQSFPPPTEGSEETVPENKEAHGKDASSEIKRAQKYSKLKKIEVKLGRARASIREAAQLHNLTSIHHDPDHVPYGPIYRNPNAFHRSYLEMEKLLKIYIYKEGEPPMFHEGPCRSIYSTEGRFIHEMEKGNLYTTNDPNQAILYFLPFSVVNLVQYLYEPKSHEANAIGVTVKDYINVISNKHSFWNRSLGADHFMLSCHDWGPRTTSYVPLLFNNSIRVLCNANVSEGFRPSKDASFPEIHLRTGEIDGLLGGLSPSRRPVLAFFAGRLHGHIRYLLLQSWKEKDEDVVVYDEVPSGISYDSMLKKSRFCLCPSGYEVASPRVVEAIYAECVPVLISEGYVPPFSDVLNWNSFAVQIQVKDIPNIKEILRGISQSQYLRMQRRVKQVQRHFILNGTPKRFDVFHMILHSIWLRRLNVHIQD